MKNFLNKHKYKIPSIISILSLIALYYAQNAVTIFFVVLGFSSLLYILYKDFTYTFTE